MSPLSLSKTLRYGIALVWLLNGLVCKVMNLVPRHQEIVGEILGHENSFVLTNAIGYSEIIMAIWIVSEWKPRYNAIIQITIIVTMNILEFILVPHLLLWGRLNLIFALLLIAVIYYNEFVLKKSIQRV